MFVYIPYSNLGVFKLYLGGYFRLPFSGLLNSGVIKMPS